MLKRMGTSSLLLSAPQRVGKGVLLPTNSVCVF